MQAYSYKPRIRRGPYRTRGSGYLRSRRISGRKVTRYSGSGRYYQRSRLMRGMGAYTENAIVSSSMPGAHNPVPDFKLNPDGSVSLSNKEYVADIFAPGNQSATGQLQAATFTNSVYPINPGIEKTFPWLCQLAENYDEYTLKQCIFTFKSSVADFASASGQVGQIIMATQYNAAQAPFADKQTMMQYAFACSGKTSEDMLQGVECDPTKISGPRGHFVRNGPVPAGYFGDLNNYDHGLLNIAVSDCPATYAGQQLGELWISYTIELRKPKFVTANGWGISRDVFVSKINNFSATPWGTSAGPNVIHAGQQNSLGSQIIRPQTVTTLIPPTPATASVQQPYFAPLVSQGSWLGTGYLATDTVSFLVQFPSYYSGNVRITLSNGVVLNDPPTIRLPALKCYPSGGANIRPIADLYNSFGDTWQNWLGTVPVGTATELAISQNRTVVLDVRVDQPTSGYPNILIFSVPAGQGQAANSSNIMIDIQEYNTAFNYKQDGTNDQICLVDASGIVVPF